MYVVYECETGWSSEDMRFESWNEAQEFINSKTNHEYNYAIRLEQ
jgi:hypothetical protein